jgi:hypothetical protein
MNEKMFFKTRIYFTVTITILIWLLLTWNYFHGGVPSHHILQRKDLPEISNWWGGLLLPLLTWFLLYRIQKRISTANDGKSEGLNISKNIIYAFLGALCFGIFLSVFFTLGYTEIPFYMLIGLLLLSLFLPVYRAECLLGFVMGMTFTFGGVLPVGVGCILSLIAVFLYKVVRPGLLFIKSGFLNVMSSKKNEKEA